MTARERDLSDRAADDFDQMRTQRGFRVAQLLERQPRWAQEFTDRRFEWRRLFSEAFGTFLLVTVGAGGAVLDHLTHGGVGRVAAVTAPGLLAATLRRAKQRRAPSVADRSQRGRHAGVGCTSAMRTRHARTADDPGTIAASDGVGRSGQSRCTAEIEKCLEGQRTATMFSTFSSQARVTAP